MKTDRNTEKGKPQISFWGSERCEYCNGLIRERTTDLPRKVKGKYVVFVNVPTGVCTQCGTRYYTANVLKSIEETLRRRPKAKREVQVPIYSF